MQLYIDFFKCSNTTDNRTSNKHFVTQLSTKVICNCKHANGDFWFICSNTVLCANSKIYKVRRKEVK